MTVRKILKKNGNNVWTLHKDATVWRAIELMAERNIGALPILDEHGKLAGIFSERDYARKCALKGRLSKETTVKMVMTPKVITVCPENKISQCMRIMSDKHIRHLPVMEGEQLIGMITIRDVVKEIISQQSGTIRELEAYINGSYGGF